MSPRWNGDGWRLAWTKTASRVRLNKAKGKVKEVAGKVLDDSKPKSEGKGDQAKGKAQNAIGGIKDTLPGK